MALLPKERLKHKSSASTLRFYGNEFVFDTVSGMFYRMNPAACFILHRLDEGIDLEELPTILQAHFSIDHSSAKRDIELFLNDLAALEPLNRFQPHHKAGR
jgi:hypothetical protein